MDIASGWVGDCLQNHGACHRVSEHAENPSRLLRIVCDATIFRLICTLQTTKYEYVALSHRWGNILQPVLTLNANLEERMRGISIETLPATFRDAIRVTKSLGYEYIWIDSLCIVQDDKVDWERECK